MTPSIEEPEVRRLTRRQVLDLMARGNRLVSRVTKSGAWTYRLRPANLPVTRLCAQEVIADNAVIPVRVAGGSRREWRHAGPVDELQMPSALRRIVVDTIAPLGVPFKEVFGPHKCRTMKAVAARHAAIRAVVAARPQKSILSIARALGVDHTTVAFVMGKLQHRQPSTLRTSHSQGVAA